MFQDPTIRAPITIALGAIAGALSRYYITFWFLSRFELQFPLPTFVINLTGCLGMGFFMALAERNLETVTPELRLLLATGFLGAYTTFSTYGLETFVLLRDRLLPNALLYWFGSAVLGVIGIQTGTLLATWISRE